MSPISLPEGSNVSRYNYLLVSSLRVVGDQDRHVASLSAGPVAPGTSHRARVASDSAVGWDPSYHATRASAQAKSSDNASAETASPADTDPMVSPGAAAASSRFG